MKKVEERAGEYSRATTFEPDSSIFDKSEALKFALRALQDPFVKNPVGEVFTDAEADTRDYYSFKSVDDCFDNLEKIASIDIDCFKVYFSVDGRPVRVTFVFPGELRGEKYGLHVIVHTEPGHNIDNWAENLDRK